MDKFDAPIELTDAELAAVSGGNGSSVKIKNSFDVIIAGGASAGGGGNGNHSFLGGNLSGNGVNYNSGNIDVSNSVIA